MKIGKGGNGARVGRRGEVEGGVEMGRGLGVGMTGVGEWEERSDEFSASTN